MNAIPVVEDKPDAEEVSAPNLAPDSANRVTPLWRIAIIVHTLVGLLFTINQVFYLQMFGLTLTTASFLYVLCACFLPIVLIVTPLRKASVEEAGGESSSHSPPGVPAYDVVLIAATIGLSLWFAWHGVEIAEFGWAFVAPTTATVLSIIYWGLVLEILRRSAGWIVMAIAAVFSVYPLVAGAVPVPFLQGVDYDFRTLAQLHVMGSESILGLPLQSGATILVGFMLFGVVLQHTGGANFFNDVALAVFGKYRGGSAKVAVGSSAAMGMMSGSPVSNVLTTGPMTIPAMIRAGFSRKTAGAIEATASSGGSITPPIMGTAAFLMVAFAGVPYTQILIAATVPAILYFLGIFLQIDGYAAQRGFKGQDPNTIPKLLTTLGKGWIYLGALALLTLLLFALNSENQVPYYVVLVLVVAALINPRMDFGLSNLRDVTMDLGISLAKIFGVVAGVGLILGGLSATGVALSLSRDLVALVGENVVLILVAGAIACFILGMGLTISAAYVFLAIVMVPALTALDVNLIAAHLFIIYWASVSYITPPVGMAAFAAAGISKASPMETSVEAMKLGAVKYVVPFGFALNPAILLQGGANSILLAIPASFIAVFGLAAALSGWLQIAEKRIGILTRIVLFVAGFACFLPQVSITLLGTAIVVVVTVAARFLRGQQQPSASMTQRIEDSNVPEEGHGEAIKVGR